MWRGIWSDLERAWGMIQPVTPMWKQMLRGGMIFLSSYNNCGNEGGWDRVAKPVRKWGLKWDGLELITSTIIYTVKLEVLYMQNEIYNVYSMDFPSASVVKNLPAKQETGVWSLSWEDPLETEMATHSSILAWRIPWTEEPGGLQSMGSQRGRHDLLTKQQQHL